MREKQESGNLVRVRTAVLISVFTCALCIFFFVLYDVQYVHGQEYLDRASYSVARTENVGTARGEILDCYGRLLVSNEAAYQVTLNTSLMGDEAERYATLWSLIKLCQEQGMEWTDSLPISHSIPFTYTLDEATEGEVSRLRKLTTLYKWDEWNRTMISGGVDDETGQPLAEQDKWSPNLNAGELLVKLSLKYKVEEYLPGLTQLEQRALIGVLYELDLRKREITYTEYVFASDVDIVFITLVKEAKLAGVSIDVVSTRRYHTTAAAHVLGRVAAMSPDQWEGDETTPGYRNIEGYSYDDRVGQDGVEKAFEEYLHGVAGTRAIETDSTGKLISESWIEEPAPGSNVVLTMDSRFQASVEEALARHIQGLEEPTVGAVAVVDMTGGVLALASHPTYNLASFSEDYKNLETDPLKPMVNRATQGTYMPGSIFKMATGLAGLQEGVITPSTKIKDTGVFTRYTSNLAWAPKCWIYRQYGGNHGLVTISDAIRDSCNVFFYDIGARVGIEKLGEYANLLGLGVPTGIEIPERTGYVAGPATSDILGTEWYEGATTAAAIGQENNLFTPLQLANYIATLVNGGTHYAAHLLKSVKSADYGEMVYEYEPTILDKIDIEPENLEALKYGMYLVTQTSSIAPYFNALPVRAGAKTGTAQVNNNTSTNATFVCFAPYDDPQIALCIVVEKGSSGASLASLAAEILQFYFTAEESLSVVSGENILQR